jgi:ribosome-associated protein
VKASDQLKIAVQAADQKRAENIIALKVGPELTPITDYFLIMDAGSPRQVEAISENIIEKMSESGMAIIRSEGKDKNNWVLLDFGDIVVHVFTAEQRDFYDLQRLWSDSELVDITEWLVPES